MKLLVLMWLLLQPSSTPLKDKSLAYSMNMPTFGRDHPFIHQVNLNGFRPMLMKHLSKLVVPNLSILWMDILSLFSSRMVWTMPPPLEDPQIRTWTHIHMSSSHLLINGTTVKSLTKPLVTPCLMLMVISISPSLPTSTPSWRHLQEIAGHTQKSLLFSQPISIIVHPKSLTGLLNAHFLHGHSPSSIKDTFNVTTRHGTAPHTQDYIKKHFKSRNPFFSIPRCSEAVATDTIFSDTPAVDDGPTMAQFFCGHDTLVCDAYGIKSTKQFISTLSDNIRKRGAMDTLTSDGGKYFMCLSTTGLILLSLISIFLHHLMKRRVIGLVLPTTQVTVSPGGSSIRILKRSSFVLAFEVLSELQQTSVLHHLQGRGPHFLFPSLILNNLKILCHLIPL